MAASKENPQQQASSFGLRPSPRSLRSPLSPILPSNTPSSRPPPLRRPLRDAKPTPPLRSPPLRHLPSPRSFPLDPAPKSSRVGRQLLHPPPSLGPRPSAPKDPPPSSKPFNTSVLPSNASRIKRQNRLVLHKPSCEPVVEKAGAVERRWARHMESEKDQKSARRRWRRIPRESVLESLRSDGQGGFLGLPAGTGKEDVNEDTVRVSSWDAKLLLGNPLVAGNLCHDLSFDTFRKPDELNHDRAEITGVRLPELPADLPFNFQAPNSSPTEVLLTDEGKPGNRTPPAEKSLTPQTEKNATPPMQPTESPDFSKRGMRGMLTLSGECFGAQCGMVKDRRKCKPRGMLTVDVGLEVQSSAESELSIRQSVQMPTPAVASVEWMLDENSGNLARHSGSEFASTSTDLCRMSFPRFSMSHFDSSSEDDNELQACSSKTDCTDFPEEGRRSVVQASTSVSGYDWGASSSQGMNSSCHTEASSAYPTGSTVLDEGGFNGDQFKGNLLSKLTSVARRKKGTTEVMKSSSSLSVEANGGLSCLQNFALSEGSPPFEYSVLNHCLEDIDSFNNPRGSEPLSKEDWNSWSKSLPEEILLSTTIISPPVDSSLSSQEQDFDTGSEISATAFPRSQANRLNNSTSSKKNDGRDERQLEIVSQICQPKSEMSSRIAMAELLCNLTATYLEQVATCLGKARTDAGGSKGRNLVGNQIELIASERLEDKGLDIVDLEHSSILMGRKTMVECCSLLRGLTLDTSEREDEKGASSECSVNQPSPSLTEDTADSYSGCVPQDRNWPSLSTGLCRSSVELVSSLCGMEESILQKSSLIAMPSEKNLNPEQDERCCYALQEGYWIPSRVFVASLYLAVGMVAICHTYYEHKIKF